MQCRGLCPYWNFQNVVMILLTCYYIWCEYSVINYTYLILQCFPIVIWVISVSCMKENLRHVGLGYQTFCVLRSFISHHRIHIHKNTHSQTVFPSHLQNKQVTLYTDENVNHLLKIFTSRIHAKEHKWIEYLIHTPMYKRFIDSKDNVLAIHTHRDFHRRLHRKVFDFEWCPTLKYNIWLGLLALGTEIHVALRHTEVSQMKLRMILYTLHLELRYMLHRDTP